MLFHEWLTNIQAFICGTDKQDPNVQHREIYSIKFAPYCCSY